LRKINLNSLEHTIDPTDIKIFRLFPTPLPSIKIPQVASLNQALSKLILDKASSIPSVKHSNIGGWQSADDFALWQEPEAQSLLKFVTNFVNTITALKLEENLVEADWQWRVNAWANVNYAGCSNAPHGHPSSFWSGVYWVDDGGRSENADIGGEIELHDPRGFMPAMSSPLRFKIEGCLSAGYSEIIVPSSGTLLMFPSWLIHSVREFKGTRPRISISFNFANYI